MTPLVLEAVVAEDHTKNYGPGEDYYPPVIGGTMRPKDEEGNPVEGFNVRTLRLRAADAPTGEYASYNWVLGDGINLVGFEGIPSSLAGKRIRITFEEVEAE